jgi:hypothetical protein
MHLPISWSFGVTQLQDLPQSLGFEHSNPSQVARLTLGLFLSPKNQKHIQKNEVTAMRVNIEKRFLLFMKFTFDFT